MTYLETSRITQRVIAEVAGTITTNGIQELSHEERGGVSAFGYVRQCLISTAYNSLRALPGFNYSFGEFFRAVEAATIPCPTFRQHGYHAGNCCIESV